MDKNTRFLVERMDEGFRDMRKELSSLREKLDALQDFKSETKGATKLGSAIISTVVSVVIGLLQLIFK